MINRVSKTLSSALSIVLTIRLRAQAQTIPAPLVLVDGAIATSSSLEDPGQPASNAIDGNFAGQLTWGSCTATTANPGEWFRVEMAESFPVRTIFHVTDVTRSFTNFFYTVGDDPDVSLNAKCSETAYTNGGLFECDLNGKYFGIYKPDADRINVCELRLYSRKTAAPYFTVSGTPRTDGWSSVYLPINPSKIGPHSADLSLRNGDSYDSNKVADAFWQLDFGVTTRFVLAVIISDQKTWLDEF